jgi:hypothetical protein
MGLDTTTYYWLIDRQLQSDSDSDPVFNLPLPSNDGVRPNT